MAGPSKDNKDAFIGWNNLTSSQKVISDRYRAGDPSTISSFGQSYRMNQRTDLWFGLNPQLQSQYLFQFSNFNLGRWEQYSDDPQPNEIQYKAGTQGGTDLELSVNDLETDGVYLPARQGEGKLIASDVAGTLYGESWKAVWDLDHGTKIVITGKGGDIVVAGLGDDAIGPGLPLESWQAAAARWNRLPAGQLPQPSSSWTSKLQDIDLGNSTLLTAASANTPERTRINMKFWLSNEAVNGPTVKSGPKAYVAGTGNDIVWGGNEDDLLIGDRYEGEEAGLPSNQAARDKLFAAIGNPFTGDFKALITDKTRREVYNGLQQKGYDYWKEPFKKSNWGTTIKSDNEAWMIGPIDSKYLLFRPKYYEKDTFPNKDGSPRDNSSIDPLWKPGNDRIFGGKGDDRIFGDDNTSSIARLRDAKEAYETQEARHFETDWGVIGNDYLNGGEGNDSINGGFGTDVIVGGPGSDIIQLPDLITAPGYKNLIKTNGDATWVLGGSSENITRVNSDRSGRNDLVANEAADIFIAGINFATEKSLQNAEVPEGQEASLSDQMDRIQAAAKLSWKDVAGQVAWDVGKTLLENIPYAGPVLSTLFGLIDAFKEKEADPSNSNKPLDADASSSDGLAVIADFGPTDLLVIPVKRGSAITYSDQETSINFNDPAEKDFSEWQRGKRGTYIQTSENNNLYNRFFLPGIVNVRSTNNAAADYGVYRLAPRTTLQDYGLPSDLSNSVGNFNDQVDIYVFASNYWKDNLTKDASLITQVMGQPLS